MNPNDLLLAALAQLATLMVANWTATEAIGNALRARGRNIPKLLISCVLAPALSVAAYGFGWFNALPATTARGLPMSVGLGYGSAAFAGLIAALVTSTAHGLVKAGGSSGDAAPPAPGTSA